MSENDSRPKRQHLAADDWLTVYPPQAPFRVRVDCGEHKPGWRPRSEGDQLRAVHAGTSLLFQDRLWEVIRYEPPSDRAGRHCYYLNPWDDHLPMHAAPFEYGEQAAIAHAEMRREVAHRQRKAHTYRFLFPLMATLPEEDQLRLEREMDFPGAVATRWSAAVLASLGVALALWPSGPRARPRLRPSRAASRSLPWLSASTSSSSP